MLNDVDNDGGLLGYDYKFIRDIALKLIVHFSTRWMGNSDIYYNYFHLPQSLQLVKNIYHLQMKV